jgi:SNF2 family DNA or RNA helicase
MMGVPSDRVLTINPADREPFNLELLDGARNYDYYIIHWDALPLVDGLRQPGVRALEWDHVIADEAHLAKNRHAGRTLDLKKIKARVKTAATGTPADDKPQDMWSILHWLDKKTWSSYWDFFNRYIKWEMAFTRSNPNGYRKIKGTQNLDELHDKIRPFYIRRKLTDVIDDMPDKTRTTMYVDLTPRQRIDYEDMVKWGVARLGEKQETFTMMSAIELHMRLQQMTAGTCSVNWEKYDKFWAKYENCPPEDMPKKVILGPTIRIGDPSPKIDALMELIETADEEEKFVVFTNFKDVVKMVEDSCRKSKIKAVSYTGAIASQKERDARVAAFQSGSARVFVGTVGAAGTSITLTAARTLIFLDRNWNPSKNEQGEDRIWRIGQKNACQIITMIARDTYDDPRLNKIWKKAQAVQDMVDIVDEEW